VEAIDTARKRDAELTVLHVDLYQNNGNVTRSELERAVEPDLGPLDRTRYVVRRGFLVEETIPEEVAAEGADVVVTGAKQAGRWRRTIRKFLDGSDIESYLKQRLDCTIVTVRANRDR
jgi:nucleotide-binding universal stress UspA family protein